MKARIVSRTVSAAAAAVMLMGAVSFTVSADGGAEQSFDFSAEDVKNYFGSAKDKYAFYVYLAGLTTGQVVTLKPYFKIGGQVVYQGTQAPEIVTYTVG